MPLYTDFDEWEKTLKPCDLLLFKGIGPIGNCIKFFETNHLKNESKWVHSGIVCPQLFIDFKNNDKNKSFIMESLVSGLDGINDVQTNKMHNGLQIRDLREVAKIKVEKEKGAIACFHLKKPLFQYNLIQERKLSESEKNAYINNNENSLILKSFWENFEKTSYDFCRCSRSVNIKLPFLCDNDGKKRLFCSEAVIRLYQYLGLINKNINPEKISPEELGQWCGDIIGDAPFYSEADILITS